MQTTGALCRNQTQQLESGHSYLQRKEHLQCPSSGISSAIINHHLYFSVRLLWLPEPHLTLLRREGRQMFLGPKDQCLSLIQTPKWSTLRRMGQSTMVCQTTIGYGRPGSYQHSWFALLTFSCSSITRQVLMASSADALRRGDVCHLQASTWASVLPHSSLLLTPWELVRGKSLSAQGFKCL